MSEKHPTPWKVNYWYDADGSKVYDDDEPIVDANGKAVVVTDSGVYPPDRETVEEIVAAMNEYNGPRDEYMRVDKDGNVERIWTVEGNGAEMRKALERVNEFFRCDEDNKARLVELCMKADEAVKAALSKPVRNCDVYLSPEDMHKAWEQSGSRKAFSDWLLSDAYAAP